MKISKVTFTGADDKTDIEDLFSMSEKYPFVEWGILMSKNNTEYVGRRFPSRKWIDKLIQTREDKKQKINLSMHICGRMVDDIVENGGKKFIEHYEDILFSFQRLQINTHAARYNLNAPAFKEFGNIISKSFGNEIIIQCDGTENQTLLFELNPEFSSGLFDLSHGNGIAPEVWPKPIANYRCGYAGGLGPDNIVEELKKIENQVCAGEIWIDMESKVRGSSNELKDYFDVKKCEEVIFKIQNHESSLLL